MTVSKATVLNALTVFKGLQDTSNANKFVAKEANKGLISSDDQSKLDGIASGAQVNIVEGVSVDGVVQPTDHSKNVVLNLSAYAKGTDVASALTYKSRLNYFSELPASGQKVGDVYQIRSTGGSDIDGVPVNAGNIVFWNGTGWKVLAGNIDLSGYVEKVEGKDLSSNDFTDEFKSKLETIKAEPLETITEAEIQALFN